MARRDLEVRVKADVGAYQKAMSAAASSTDELAQAGLRLQKLGLSVSNLGDTLTKNVTLPLALAGGAALKLSSDFEKSFTTMQTLAGVSAGEVDNLKESVLDLAGETGRAPQELAEALYFLQSSGLDSAQAMDALEMSAKASAAGLGDTATVADAVSSAMLAYAKSGLTAAEATDVLVETARQGKAEPAELAGQMGRLVPIASELGITFGDVGGAIAALSTKGNSAEQATTQLTNVMSKLLKPSEQAKQLLEEVGLSTDTIRQSIAEKGLLATLEELRAKLGENGFVKFLEDQQAVQGGLALLGGDLEATRDIFEAVNDSAGATSNAFSTWAESMGAENAQAFAQFQVALIQIGDVIAPIASEILGFVSQLVSLFSELPQPVQTAVVAFAALAAATGPFLSVSGRLITAFGTMIRLASEFVVPAGTVSGAFNTSAAAAGGLTTRLAPLAAGISILGPLAIGAGIAFQAWSDTKAEAARVSDKLTDALEREAQGMEGAADAALAAELTAGDLGERLRDAEADISVFNDAIRESGEGIETLEDLGTRIAEMGLEDALEHAGLAGSAFADELLRLNESMGTGAIIELIDRVDGLSDRYDEVSSSASEAAATEQFLSDQHAGSSETINGLTVEITEATSALQAYNDALRAQFDPLFGAINASAQLTEANAAVAAAELNLAAATRDHGAGSLEAMAAQDELTAAQIRAGEAALGYESSLVTLADAVQNGDVSVDTAIGTLQQWVAQGRISQATADAVAASFYGEADAANSIPAAKNTHVTTTGTGEAVSNLQAVTNKVNEIDKDVTIRIGFEVYGQAELNRANALTGRQHGGPVLANEAYIVGENGPEVLLMGSQSGQIIPNGEWGMSPAADGMGGSSLGDSRYAQALSEMLWQIASGGQIFEDFHWAGASQAVRDFNDIIAKKFYGSGGTLNRQQMQDFLTRELRALTAPSGGGGSYVYSPNIVINTGADPQQVVEAIKRYERSNGPVWRN